MLLYRSPLVLVSIIDERAMAIKTLLITFSIPHRKGIR